MTLRPASLTYFSQARHSVAPVRGQNFTVHRFVHSPEKTHSITSGDEILFIFPETGGELETVDGIHQIPPRAFVIASPGKIDVRPDGLGSVYALTTGATQPAKELAVNAVDYRITDRRVKPVCSSLASAADRREDLHADLRADLRVYLIDQMQFPAENSRLKFLRTKTMSINWVEYEGPRNRAQLSPHAHTDFEQGSLAISGNFIHHIRTPWAPDANQWQEDRHLDASADSVLIVPPELIHTTEGVGEGRHVLIDIFAPPREDFIAKGWVHNAGEYAAR
jgi:mannose-6-phosphate isomerase-like protein (cupin superfamily)